MTTTATERAARYLASAIETAVDTVRTAAPGIRNPELFRQAAAIAGLRSAMARHWVDVPTDAALYLLFRDAASTSGLLAKKEGGERQFKQSFKSAITRGSRNPRKLPDDLESALAAEASGSSAKPRPRVELPAPLPPEPPTYPPPIEVSALWGACVPVTDDEEVATWLREARCIDPVRIADEDLARALPRDAAAPWWARYGGQSWAQGGYRVIVPLYDHLGELRSVLARGLAPAEGDAKSVPPVTFNRTGLAMMCPLARQVVTAGARPAWWPAGVELRIVVAEGEVDYLTVASEWSDAAACAPATIAIVNGSWTAEHAARIPDDAVVLVATHHDAGGEDYARKILKSFDGRDVHLERTRAAA